MRFLLIVFFCCSTGFASIEEGRLVLYSEASQNGTTACRTFTNENQLPSKIIYYRSKLNCLGPAIESDIYQYETQLLVYQGEKEIWRGVYSEDYRLLKALETEYGKDNKRNKMQYRDSDGIVRYIMLCEGSKIVSHIYLDDTGSKIIRVQGKLPPDVDPASIELIK